MSERSVAGISASAPAKAILFGEHGVNRGQPALATAVGPRRVHCRVKPREDGAYAFRSGKTQKGDDREGLLAFKAEVDALRGEGDLDGIGTRARDFFAPARYVLAHVLERSSVSGLDIEWSSDLPIGSGLGAGAAAMCALALAALRSAGEGSSPEEIATLAWQGDVIAHGGTASGLDSGACALGGFTRYTLEEGPQPLPQEVPLPLVIGDTRIGANTAEVNARVRRRIEEHPSTGHLFAEIGALVGYALTALEAGDLETLGHLMNLNQLALEKLGVSSGELERLIEAALEAGALGAKLSGSGGGGVMIALARDGEQETVARAIDAAGGRGIVAEAGAEGVSLEERGPPGSTGANARTLKPAN